MTSERPYAERRTLDDALAEIEGCAGSQFDPVVVDALLSLDRSLIVATLGLDRAQPAPASREPVLALVRA